MKRLPVLVAAFAVGACSENPGPSALDLEPSFVRVGTPAGYPSEVIISFGRDDVGTEFFPPGEHDRSFHAKDKIRPRVVHLAAGGEVVFDMGSFHGVAIYEPGTTPDDIEISPATLEDLVLPFPPFLLEGFLINDPDGRVADRSPVSMAPMQWSPPEGIFDEPGRYLVLCYVLPHFVEAKMYAYIEVR
jgi:hypothetical protein